MNYKQTIELIAHRKLTDQELVDFTRDQWGMIVSWLAEHDSERTGFFPITHIHRDDLEGEGYDVSKVTDSDMVELADMMSESYAHLFFSDMTFFADNKLKIPKK